MSTIALVYRLTNPGSIRHQPVETTWICCEYIGFSFHGTVDDLRNIVSAHKWDFAQIQMNYLDWENQNAKMQYQILEDAGIPTIVMEPVRGGKLALK